jgi:hypothetical protein
MRPTLVFTVYKRQTILLVSMQSTASKWVINKDHNIFQIELVKFSGNF